MVILQKVVLIFVLSLVPLVAIPLTAAAATPPTSLTDLAWIAGDWMGGEGDTLIHEQWSTPEADDMMGMFRLIESGRIVFYEFMTITQEDSGPILRIKHFDSGLVGWEEKGESIVFRLSETGDQRAVFETEKNGQIERLIFQRIRDELVVTLEKPATATSSEFRYQRKQDDKKASSAGNQN